MKLDYEERAGGKWAALVHDGETIFVERVVSSKAAAIALLKKADEQGWHAISVEGDPEEPVRPLDSPG